MRYFISWIAAAFIVCGTPLGAQTSNPDSVGIHTGDISRFWRAIDRAARANRHFGVTTRTWIRDRPSRPSVHAATNRLPSLASEM